MVKRILILTGAGASVPLKMPTTNDFFHTTSLRSEQMFSLLREHIGTEDLEKIVGVLDSFTRQDGSVYKLSFGEDYLCSQYQKQNAREFLKDRKDKAKEFLKNLKGHMFDVYGKPHAASSYELYFNLIKQIKELYEPCSISFFTTNYDLSTETAFRQGEKNEWKKIGINKFDYCFQEEGRDRFINVKNSDFDWAIDAIEFLKLHGSLDWHRDELNRCVPTNLPIRPFDPDEAVLLYPGFKEYGLDEPFSSIHWRFSNRLHQADIMIVIGFSFRDPLINAIFETALNNNKKIQVHCYNPILIDQLPDGSGLVRIADRYVENIHYHKIPFESKENPLVFEINDI